MPITETQPAAAATQQAVDRLLVLVAEGSRAHGQAAELARELYGSESYAGFPPLAGAVAEQLQFLADELADESPRLSRTVEEAKALSESFWGSR
jgi:hypothetical protein